MENSFKAQIELPATNALEKECAWITPEFPRTDSIIPTNLWSPQATFNLRCVGMSVAIEKSDLELYASQIPGAKFFYDPQESTDQTIYTCYIRPHYSVQFRVRTKERQCEGMRVLALSLPTKRRRFPSD
jgi:hypothetical protein